MIAILLILFIILLFAAVPTWPYSASGRARYRVGSARNRTSRAAKPPQLASRETMHTMRADHASQLRELQNDLQASLDRTAKGSLGIAKLRESDRSSDCREQQAA